MLVGFPLAVPPAKEPEDDCPWRTQLQADFDGLFSVFQAIITNQEIVPSALTLDKPKAIELFRSVHEKDLSDNLLNEIDISLGISGSFKTILDDPSKDNYTKKEAALKCTG